MQTLLLVYCVNRHSLRDAIANDSKLGRHGFKVTKHQQPGRAPGWMKLHSTKSGRRGALNLDWDSDAQVLRCRAVNRGKGEPSLVLGDFVEYLFARYRRRIRMVTITPL